MTQVTPLDTLMTAAKEHLLAFNGRVLPTLSMIGKLPLIRGGCRSAATSIGAVHNLFTQSDAYGRGMCATGFAYYPASDVTVFDLDEKNGKSGSADIAYVAQQIGCPLPETATVSTPSGGVHQYFLLPEGATIPHSAIGKIGRPIADANGKRLPTGVDIFGHHPEKSQWVAGPGTVTAKGEYTWANNLEPAMLPQPWIDYINAAVPPKSPRDPSKPRPDRGMTTQTYVEQVLAVLDPDTLGHAHRFTVRAVIMEEAILTETGAELAEEDKILLLRKWCTRNPRFDADAFDRSIDNVLGNLGDDSIDRATLGTLHMLAQANGYTGPAPSVALAIAKTGPLFVDRTPLTPETPLVLSKGTPMPSAREMIRRQFTVDGLCTLVRHQGEFHHWDGKRYVTMADEVFAGRVRGFLDGALRVDKDKKQVPFDVVNKDVTEVVSALAAQTHTPAGAEAPCWLYGRTGPDPKQILAISNGLLNLTTRELQPHTPAYFCPNALDFSYNAAATTPAWDLFLSQVFPGDQQVTDTLQEMFGLFLTPDTRHQKAFLLRGPPRAGKGTILRILTALLGSANVCSPTLASLGEARGKEALIGKRAAIMGDVNLGKRADLNAVAETLLSITGEDNINIRRLFKTDWSGRLQTRFLLSANLDLEIDNASGALASRFIIMTTKQTFKDKEDHGLEDRLMQELPGIMNWALAGLVRLRERGRFVQPASSADAALEMEHKSSPVKKFLYEMCIVSPEHTITPTALYDAYVTWATTVERSKNHLNLSSFGSVLHGAIPGLTTPKVGGRGHQERRYQGVGLRADADVRTTEGNVTPFQAVATVVPAPATSDSINVPAAPYRSRKEIRAERIAELAQRGVFLSAAAEDVQQTRQ